MMFYEAELKISISYKEKRVIHVCFLDVQCSKVKEELQIESFKFRYASYELRYES